MGTCTDLDNIQHLEINTTILQEFSAQSSRNKKEHLTTHCSGEQRMTRFAGTGRTFQRASLDRQKNRQALVHTRPPSRGQSGQQHGGVLHGGCVKNAEAKNDFFFFH